MINPIKNILSKEMSRQDFLKYTGFMLLSFIGAFGVLSRMNDLDMLKLYKKQTKGYGSSPYEGKGKA